MIPIVVGILEKVLKGLEKKLGTGYQRKIKSLPKKALLKSIRTLRRIQEIRENLLLFKLQWKTTW